MILLSFSFVSAVVPVNIGVYSSERFVNMNLSGFNVSVVSKSFEFKNEFVVYSWNLSTLRKDSNGMFVRNVSSYRHFYRQDLFSQKMVLSQLKSDKLVELKKLKDLQSIERQKQFNGVSVETGIRDSRSIKNLVVGEDVVNVFEKALGLIG